MTIGDSNSRRSDLTLSSLQTQSSLLQTNHNKPYSLAPASVTKSVKLNPVEVVSQLLVDQMQD